MSNPVELLDYTPHPTPHTLHPTPYTLLKNCIKKVEVLEYPELGMEAIWKIEVLSVYNVLLTCG